MFLGDQNGVDRVPPEEAGVDFIHIALANALALRVGDAVFRLLVTSDTNSYIISCIDFS